MINKILEVIKEQNEQDANQKAWCLSERSSNDASLADKVSQITTLDGDITTLDGVIEDPVTGLKKLIANDEDSFHANSESQKTETEARKSENLAYQKNVQNLVKAQALMTKAITVLQAYYSKILEAPGGSTLIAVSRVKQMPMPA